MLEEFPALSAVWRLMNGLKPSVLNHKWRNVKKSMSKYVQLDEFLVDRLAALHSPSGRAPPRSAEYDRRQDIEEVQGELMTDGLECAPRFASLDKEVANLRRQHSLDSCVFND